MADKNREPKRGAKPRTEIVKVTTPSSPTPPVDTRGGLTQALDAAKTFTQAHPKAVSIAGNLAPTLLAITLAATAVGDTNETSRDLKLGTTAAIVAEETWRRTSLDERGRNLVTANGQLQAQVVEEKTGRESDAARVKKDAKRTREGHREEVTNMRDAHKDQVKDLRIQRNRATQRADIFERALDQTADALANEKFDREKLETSVRTFIATNRGEGAGALNNGLPSGDIVPERPGQRRVEVRRDGNGRAQVNIFLDSE
ncbi:MAG TPA: hypothetical protein VEW42_05925 [Candidatus Eisenbacteria bacterium]|nr:hypothetical protein [Candidatus Eisenbacteria bacterium]